MLLAAGFAGNPSLPACLDDAGCGDFETCEAGQCVATDGRTGFAISKATRRAAARRRGIGYTLVVLGEGMHGLALLELAQPEPMRFAAATSEVASLGLVGAGIPFVASADGRMRDAARSMGAEPEYGLSAAAWGVYGSSFVTGTVGGISMLSPSSSTTPWVALAMTAGLQVGSVVCFDVDALRSARSARHPGGLSLIVTPGSVALAGSW